MPASQYAEQPERIASECRAAQNRDAEVSTDVARAIAGQWHDGQASAFYAFASSGHYDRDALLRELSDTIAQSYTAASTDDCLTLDMLGTYLINRED